MKKTFILICALFMLSSVAFAEETCANGAGKIVIGDINQKKYCLSNKTMNFWNAYAWCDAQETNLVDLTDCACSDTTADCAENKCPNFGSAPYGYREVWTSAPHDTNKMKRIVMATYLPNGSVGQWNKDSSGAGMYALCKQK
ncbi:MAG: hypothetical protein IKL32_06640 [Alphaproteobacteria bacterium]|nr:hypothetical protein [Alphaproteobacteria bacterium]